ncbi:MAG: hypothetical protein HYY02_01500 [Chloroflexi bacterium]|nr:hypothetical protein [Chloroflexota bacterium]
MPLLRIVVAGQCPGCEEARRLYEEVGRRFPDLPVELVDLEGEMVQKPDAVVAVPTFLLDENVLFVGNPFPEELNARLAQLYRPQ